MSILDVASERCCTNPWFDPNHETVILGKTVKHDDDPLLNDDSFRFSAKARGGYPELPRIQLPSEWLTGESEFPYHPRFVSRIGQSGWDYVNKLTRYICLEFDVDIEHVTTGITHMQLAEIGAELSNLPYVEVRRSTGGNGLHIRVPLVQPVPAPTRGEYQATIKKIYSYLCSQVPMIRDKVDRSALGRGVLWLWADHTNERSFELLSSASEKLDLGDWRPAICEKSSVALPIRTLSDGYDIQEVLDRIGVQCTTKRYDTADNGIGYLIACPRGHENDSDSKTMVWSQNGVPCCRCFADKCKNLTWPQYLKAVAPDDPAAKLNSTEWAVLSIIHLASDDELFHDESGNAYVTCPYKGGPAETFLITSDQYRHVLRRRYNGATSRVASEEAISLAISELTSRAILESPQFKVHVRVATKDSKYYLDLCNDKRQAVEISKEGWQIVEVPDGVRFVRPTNLRALPTPQRGGGIELLRKYITVNDGDWPLILAWLVCAMRPDIACAALVMIGSAGSGKSNQLELLASTFHPTAAPEPKDFTVPGVPKSLDDLMVTAFNTWIVGVDNVSLISQSLSDCLCCLITGAARGTRALYSDNGLSVFTVRRPIMLASTAQVISASDLADRCLIVEVPAIKNRIAEHTLWSEFRKDRPKILGALLDGFVEGLRSMESVDLTDPPRMMDFAKFATAAETAFGLERGATIKAMKARQASIAEEAVADSPLAQRLIELATEGFEGTATELITKLGESEEWSTSPRKFRNQLNLVIPDLRKLGIKIDQRKKDGKTVWTLTAAEHTTADALDKAA